MEQILIADVVNTNLFSIFGSYQLNQIIMKNKFFVFFLLFTLTISNSFSQKKGKSISLLDKELSNFDIWLSIPHTSVTDLPEGTYQSDKINSGDPIGLNNNLKNIFSIIEEDGEPVLKITGEIFGCISSKTSYENYHLSVMFKCNDFAARVWSSVGVSL